jgi:hypothetical protein
MTWPYAYPVAALVGFVFQCGSLLYLGAWGLLLAPVTVLLMVCVIGLLDDRLRARGGDAT